MTTIGHSVESDQLRELREQLAAQAKVIAANEQLIAANEKELSLRQRQLDEREEHIEWLEERLALLQSNRYKHSSEKYDALQGRLFDESELDAEINDIRDKLDKAKRQSSKPRKTPGTEATDHPKRKSLPDHLRRVNIDVDVSEDEKHLMGDEWEQIGWEESEQLACQEREYYVKRYRRAKYVRRSADQNNAGGIKVAPVQPVILPRAMVDASVLAKIITGKFVDALSFNRERKVLEREGAQISYSTLCSYPIQLNERLEAFKEMFYEYAGEQSLWHLDETTLQVLQEADREARQKSYLWALRAGPPDAPVVLFHYDPRRNYEALHSWLSPTLERFSGVIITDEHKPYERLCKETPGIKARGGCWAHARRKFVDAVKGRRHDSDAHRMVKSIKMLFKLDKQIAQLQGEEKLIQRNKLIGPWLESFKAQVDELAPVYLKTGLMQKALYYVQNNWESLTRFMHHADLPLTNNAIEGSIRPFAVGRRNWLYSASPRGAHASAFMYSLVETARANGLEPKAYLQALFERYPLAKTDEQRRALLPMFFKFS
jgi:transposase